MKASYVPLLIMYEISQVLSFSAQYKLTFLTTELKIFTNKLAVLALASVWGPKIEENWIH